MDPFWRNPNAGNFPEKYASFVGNEKKSQFLVDLVEELNLPKVSKILEIGCNAGRNLVFLNAAGYTNFTAIECYDRAIKVFEKTSPEVFKLTKIHVEDAAAGIMKIFEDNSFDIIFTMAVLEHISYVDDVLFKDMVRTTKFLISIEDEQCARVRHFPRNYKTVFESLGMQQIKEINCKDIEGLDIHFNARVFKKENVKGA